MPLRYVLGLHQNNEGVAETHTTYFVLGLNRGLLRSLYMLLTNSNKVQQRDRGLLDFI